MIPETQEEFEKLANSRERYIVAKGKERHTVEGDFFHHPGEMWKYAICDNILYGQRVTVSRKIPIPNGYRILDSRFVTNPNEDMFFDEMEEEFRPIRSTSPYFLPKAGDFYKIVIRPERHESPEDIATKDGLGDWS